MISIAAPLESGCGTSVTLRNIQSTSVIGSTADMFEEGANVAERPSVDVPCTSLKRGQNSHSGFGADRYRD
jgi:hypothetical protein